MNTKAGLPSAADLDAVAEEEKLKWGEKYPIYKPGIHLSGEQMKQAEQNYKQGLAYMESSLARLAKQEKTQPMENHLWDLYRPETEERYTPGVVLMAIFELLLIGFIFYLAWAFGAAAK